MLVAGPRDWWLKTLEDWAEEPEPEYEATAESLSGWPEGEAVPYFRKREVDKHALGEVLTANAFEGLARYEVHLDRKLERTLTMLIRLRDLRRGSPET